MQVIYFSKLLHTLYLTGITISMEKYVGHGEGNLVETYYEGAGFHKKTRDSSVEVVTIIIKLHCYISL